jgi:hypothetical protein
MQRQELGHQGQPSCTWSKPSLSTALAVRVKKSRGGIDELIKPGTEHERVELLVEP